ncbi:MAG TPA: diguanylate cyclase, partial [Candidatus Deferrimicrobium sp.]|nr:diguanylate cyclase [Candidatus Deferrimicrobium sp.]
MASRAARSGETPLSGEREVVGRPQVAASGKGRRRYTKLENTGRAIHDSLSGVVAETQGLMREIEKLKDAQATIEHLALTDALTGLANRTLLTDRMNQGLRGLKRSHGFIGVLMLDLDHFKVINDTLGHQVGDAVLVEAARRLQHLARPDDTVARFGGDEFVLLVQGLVNPGDLTAFADRVVAGLGIPYRIGGEEVVATVSVGVAVTSQADSVTTDLLREADMAMYRAKDRGRNRHEVFGASLQVRATERLGTERVLRRALLDKRLVVEYQPIVDLATGTIVEAEALLRIDDVEEGRLQPDHFLGVAAETGLLPVMDEWVRGCAMGALVRWRDGVPGNRIERVAVNLTARELATSDFTSRLAAALDVAGLAGSDFS